MDPYILLLEVTLLVFIINLPFGYWRSNVNKMSLQWFLAVHIPVPLIIAIRIMTDVGFHWTTYPVFIFAFFAGQYIGGMIHGHLKQKRDVSSCMLMDLYRHLK